MNNKYHKGTNGLFLALLGGMISYLLFTFISEFIGGRNTEGAILASTVTLCIIICFCTGELLDKMNK
jgi:mannitol-specific phosphotransferase system IIBC component